jgi:hypothetical protein
MDMGEDTHPTDRPPHSNISPPEEAQWQQVRPSKRRPLETPDDSFASDDYANRVVSLRLALRSASPTSLHHLAEEYAGLLAEDPLMLPNPRGKMQRHDLDFSRSLVTRPTTPTP